MPSHAGQRPALRLTGIDTQYTLSYTLGVDLGEIMRTNVVLDEDLVEEALALTGVRTKRQLLREALQELIRARKKKDLTDLAGKIRFADGYDPKEAWSKRDDLG